MIYQGLRLPLTVTTTVPETPGCRSIFFARPRGFSFEAGDWMGISLQADQPAGGTTYSLASSPAEPELRITFREGVSPFKKVLAALQPGDQLVLTEYGNDYGFRLAEHQASTLIAGGVGVAPFRSMLRQLVEQGSRSSVRLVYFNTSADFLYRDELDAWQAQLPGLTVTLIPTKDLKRKDREKIVRQLVTDPSQRYYISGPSGMVQNTRLALEKWGARPQSIKVDDFGPY